MPHLQFILTTDADTIVAPDWVDRNIGRLEAADVVCGKVTPIDTESHLIADMHIPHAELEGRYRQLVVEFYRRCTGDDLRHAEASGASIGLKLDVYKSVDGFPEVATGEDRDLVRRARVAGFSVDHSNDVTVCTSLRLKGRAPGGMAEALRARVAGGMYSIDESLPPAGYLWQHRSALPPWPHDGSGYDALSVSELPDEIVALESMLASPQLTSARVYELSDKSSIACEPFPVVLPSCSDTDHAQNAG
ncbi:glycosyltransferase [Roseovarius nanhaiticus]|uniref:glycosyltransferase n=1 Tax=Roseovarius nanhaiticus TaxID=573024 RepID=UPI00248F82B5|nr:hypothetical protein [Roseovarius nanhaiticus]